MSKKILVVGAGMAGATIARLLADNCYQVTVIDARDHIAGNCYDYVNEYGIRVHQYGPHLFHTSNTEAVEWLSRFTHWVDYEHKVKALLNTGQYVTLPVNKETKEIVGEENVLDVFFRPYTRKMWGKELDELDPAILKRVPIRDDMNELYFPNDSFQKMPALGYTAMFEEMLAHPNITVQLSTPFDKSMESEYAHVFNSMAIDEYFDYCHGELPYRSIRFEVETHKVPQKFPAAVVNFTDDGPRTRVTEWKHIPMHGDNPEYTTITYESPCDYKDNNMERYYPVKDLDGKNQEIYHKYRAMTPSNVTFIGRCGTYQYLDMWMVVCQTLKIFDNWTRV